MYTNGIKNYISMEFSRSVWADAWANTDERCVHTVTTSVVSTVLVLEYEGVRFHVRIISW